MLKYRVKPVGPYSGASAPSFLSFSDISGSDQHLSLACSHYLKSLCYGRIVVYPQYSMTCFDNRKQIFSESSLFCTMCTPSRCEEFHKACIVQQHFIGWQLKTLELLKS